MAKGEPWTEEDEKILKAMYKDYNLTVYDIADELNRTVNAITSRAYKLGIRKNPHHNFTFRHSDPSKLIYRSGECFGKAFMFSCIDNCDEWFRCLDLWIDNVIVSYLEKPKPMIFDDAGFWTSE